MTTTTTTPITHYIVRVSSDRVPCKGRYERIAVLEVTADLDSVPMISERARGVVRIVRTWERQHVGKTSRSAASRAYSAALDLVDDLTAEREQRACEWALQCLPAALAEQVC